MATPSLENMAWRKSSYSGQGGDCLEVCDGVPDVTPIRDSKQPRGPVLVFPANSWSVFVRTLKNDA
ncbi:DUF397 domain-containing protein [Streptomyces sp. NPDC088554]|uniref:DUF397 domain-containing protein n=1 Tax=Streptomyces sp. NPDC088554 TaxID=3365865 RepID=UPI00382CB3D4